MGRRNPATPETREEARKRLVDELRLFGHKESADLLEADGKAGELHIEFGVWSPNARGKAKLQNFHDRADPEYWARSFADAYRGMAVGNIHRDPEACGVWRLVSDGWMPLRGYEETWNAEEE